MDLDQKKALVLVEKISKIKGSVGDDSRFDQIWEKVAKKDWDFFILKKNWVSGMEMSKSKGSIGSTALRKKEEVSGIKYPQKGGSLLLFKFYNVTLLLLDI